jgi:hypothetical protein
MIKILLVLLLLSCAARAQTGNVELMPGNRYLHQMHSVEFPLSSSSKFSWQQLGTIIKYYDQGAGKKIKKDELMNQSYLMYKLSDKVAIKSGLFYTNVGGYHTSVALQFKWKLKQGILLLSPRTNLSRVEAYELFSLVEYKIGADKKWPVVVRYQGMSSVGLKGHNRSYQAFRIGMQVKKNQLGAGITLDEFGKENPVYSNFGIYFRRVW